MNSAFDPGMAAIVPSRHQPQYRAGYTLRDLLTTVFYHRRAMLIAFVIPVLIGLAAALLATPAYVAQARLLILYGSEYFYRPAAGQPQASVALDRNEIVTGELQVLQSNALALDTLKSVGVDRVYPGTNAQDPAAMGRAAERMGHDLSLSSVAQSNVLELSFRSYDPVLAAEVLRTLIVRYLERRTAIFQHAPTQNATDEQKVFLARMQAAGDALAKFADQHAISNVDQQMTLLLQQQSLNRQEQDGANQALSEATAKLEALRQQIARLPPNLQTYAESDRSQQSAVLTDTLARLLVQRRDMSTKYQENSAAVQDVDRRTAAIQAQIAREPSRANSISRTGVNTVYQEARSQEITLRTQVPGLRAKVTELTANSAVIEARIKELTNATREYRDLARNRDLLDDIYRSYVRSNEEAQIADIAERSRAANIRVVQPPETPTAGTSPRRLLLLGGVLVGLIASVATLALLNAFTRVFVSVRDASVGLDLPVLAAVPLLGPGPRRARQPQETDLLDGPTPSPQSA